jgi:hypothetical protein
MKAIVWVIILSLVVAILICFRPFPTAVEPLAYENAAAWCEKRIVELPPGDRNRRFFEISLRDIHSRNIRYDIDTPSGLHINLLMDFSKAWHKHTKQS